MDIAKDVLLRYCATKINYLNEGAQTGQTTICEMYQTNSSAAPGVG